MAYHAGLSAEDRIADDYERSGYPVAQRRWHGKGGEIDLIAQDGDRLVFIEVKQSPGLIRRRFIYPPSDDAFLCQW